MWPFPWWSRPGVRSGSRDLAYAPGGRASSPRRLPAPTIGPPAGPILIHLHGGAFRVGRKSLDGRPALIHRLAAAVGSASARTTGSAGRWRSRSSSSTSSVRSRGRRRTPRSSAPIPTRSTSPGARPAATSRVPRPSPRTTRASNPASRASTPRCVRSHRPLRLLRVDRNHADCRHRRTTTSSPTLLRSHSSTVTRTPSSSSRMLGRFADDLRSESRSTPVVYAELPGAHHDFDLFHSIRFESVVTGRVVRSSLCGRRSVLGARRRRDGRRAGQRWRPRIMPLVGTPVPAVTSTCSTSGTWFTDVPRS